MTVAARTISVIIPTLNEERSLGATIEAVRGVPEVGEIIVADGGSADGTVALAQRLGARTIDGPRGRGSQLRAGAGAASLPVLWFVHADVLPPAASGRLIGAALSLPGIVGGHFRLRFDGGRRAASFLSWFTDHLRPLGLAYGDSAFFVRRDVYDRVGGFRDCPIFEDLDLLRRLRRAGRFVRVDGFVAASSRRFEGRSFALCFGRWIFMQALYWLDVPPQMLGRLYPDVRGPDAGSGCAGQQARAGALTASRLKPEIPGGKAADAGAGASERSFTAPPRS